MKALVVGGGFGGIVACHTLRNLLGAEHEVLMVSQNSDFSLRAAFPRLAFEGELVPEEIRVRLDQALPARGIHFQQARVTAILPERRIVETSEGTISYDYLIIALGTHYAAEKIAGLREHSYSLWTVDEAQRLGNRLKSFTGGSFVTGAAVGSPCEGPTWEATMLMDHVARARGIRDQVEIHLVTPAARALQAAGPAGQRWAQETFGTLGVQVHSSADIVEITGDQVRLRDGQQLRADLALIMAPYVGHAVVAGAGLGDEQGFVPVDTHMRSRLYRTIFAIGDAVSLPQRPKMAHNAMRGAQVAATNIAHEILGQPSDWEQHDELMCVIENGGGKGTYVKSDVPWGGSLSVVMGAHAESPGLSAEEAHFLKKAFGDHFLATRGNVRYIL